jgi:hypothetical protein
VKDRDKGTEGKRDKGKAKSRSFAPLKDGYAQDDTAVFFSIDTY